MKAERGVELSKAFWTICARLHHPTTLSKRMFCNYSPPRMTANTSKPDCVNQIYFQFHSIRPNT